MERIATLKEAIQDCQICDDLLPLGPRPVLQINSQARILIAAQAPGIRVHKTGIPFNDPSGDRLREWMGISREIFYDETMIALVPMGFCYPGTGKSGDLPPRKECSAKWREDVLACLPNIELTLVIGQYAMAYHLPDKFKRLTDCVKDWKAYSPNIIPLPHPSPRNNIWLKRNPWFVEDLLPDLKSRVAAILQRG